MYYKLVHYRRHIEELAVKYMQAKFYNLVRMLHVECRTQLFASYKEGRY